MTEPADPEPMGDHADDDPSGTRHVGVRIRRLTPADLPGVETLVRAAIARGEFAASSDVEGTYFIRYAALDPLNVAIALDADSIVEVIAFCATSPRRVGGVAAQEAGIWTIGVRPEWQGRGLGRQLLRWGVGYLRSNGASRVTLSVNGRNDRARSLYESEGFEQERTRERWARPARLGEAS